MDWEGREYVNHNVAVHACVLSHSSFHTRRITLLSYFRWNMTNIGENKLDNFNQQVDAKFQDLNVYIDGEVTKLVSRIEKNSSNINKIISQDSVTPPSPLECIEKCIVISGLVFAPQEDLPYKIATMLEKIDCGSVILEDAKRMGNAPNPLVKVAMSRSDKAMVLSKKGRLRNVAGYGRVYIRTSKTMEARAMETNMRTIANLFPQLSFMNGRLVPRVEGQQHMQQSAVYPPPPYQMQPAYHQPYQAQGYAQSNFRFAQSNQQAQRPVPTPSQGQQPASQDQRIQLASQDQRIQLASQDQRMPQGPHQANHAEPAVNQGQE